jgi:hypothetical protein
MPKLKNLIGFVSVFMLVTSAAVTAGEAGSSSTAVTKDARKIQTLTNRTQSECNIFSPQGALMCSRTYPITDHAVAVAKCAAVKC